MDADEKIHAQVLSVWREAKKIFSFLGTEVMLFVTDRHLMFVNKTEGKMKWWQAATKRQVLTLLKSNNIMLLQDGYDEEELRIDLENKKNLEKKKFHTRSKGEFSSLLQKVPSVPKTRPVKGKERKVGRKVGS